MPSKNQIAGTYGEDLAAQFLEERGFLILDRNYRFQRAEVDLVCFMPAENAVDGGELVFVEVKARWGARYGRGEESVDWSKQKNLIRAARAWLHEQRMDRTPCRFDVLSLEWKGDPTSSPEILHIKDAFRIE